MLVIGIPLAIGAGGDVRGAVVALGAWLPSRRGESPSSQPRNAAGQSSEIKLSDSRRHHQRRWLKLRWADFRYRIIPGFIMSRIAFIIGAHQAAIVVHMRSQGTATRIASAPIAMIVTFAEVGHGSRTI
jgi:hypothetical protein